MCFAIFQLFELNWTKYKINNKENIFAQNLFHSQFSGLMTHLLLSRSWETSLLLCILKAVQRLHASYPARRIMPIQIVHFAFLKCWDANILNDQKLDINFLRAKGHLQFKSHTSLRDEWTGSSGFYGLSKSAALKMYVYLKLFIKVLIKFIKWKKEIKWVKLGVKCVVYEYKNRHLEVQEKCMSFYNMCARIFSNS